jgi:TetR/AcrR family transcriptional repressor of mexJK operon
MTKPTQRNRHAEILEIAGEIFLEHGYAATSMSKVAAAVGGSKGTLYSYFASKEALFEAFIREKINQEVPAVLDLPSNTGNVEKTLSSLGSKFIELITDDQIVSILRIAYHDAHRFPFLGQVFYEAGPQSLAFELKKFIQRAHQNGDLNAPNHEMAAEQFIVLCQAKFHLPFILGLQDAPTAREAKAIIKAAVSTFMAAYKPKGVSPS